MPSRKKVSSPIPFHCKTCGSIKVMSQTAQESHRRSCTLHVTDVPDDTIKAINARTEERRKQKRERENLLQEAAQAATQARIVQVAQWLNPAEAVEAAPAPAPAAAPAAPPAAAAPAAPPAAAPEADPAEAAHAA